MDTDVRSDRLSFFKLKASIQAALEMAASRLGLSPQIAWEGGWSFTIKAAYTGLTFLTTVLLARFLGAADYGVYAFAYSIGMLVTIPTQAGLPNLIVRETARGTAQSRPDLVKGIWRWSVQVVGVLSLVLVLLASFALLLWRDSLSRTQGLTLAWTLILVPLMALGNLRGAALRGLKRIVAGQLPEFVVRPALYALLLAGVVLLAGLGLSAHMAMALRVLAALIAFIIGAWMLWRYTPISVREAKPASHGRIWLISSMLFALIAGFRVINSEISTVMLGLFDSSKQVGIYRVAVQVATLASFGLQAVNMVVAPRFADLYTKGKMASLQRLVTGSARVVLGFNLILTALFVMVGKPFFSLVFGPDFTASYGILLILLVGQMLNSAMGSVAFLLNMTGHESNTLRIAAVTAIANLTLNLVLIPLWSAKGAAIATAVSMIILNVWLWHSVRLKLHINSMAFDLFSTRKTMPSSSDNHLE